MCLINALPESKFSKMPHWTTVLVAMIGEVTFVAGLVRRAVGTATLVFIVTWPATYAYDPLI
jgi:hypothetical protein